MSKKQAKAASPTNDSKGSKRPSSRGSVDRKAKLEALNQRPTRHFCSACTQGPIILKDLLMVQVTTGGHKTMQAHHRGCYKQG